MSSWLKVKQTYGIGILTPKSFYLFPFQLEVNTWNKANFLSLTFRYEWKENEKTPLFRINSNPHKDFFSIF